MVALNGFKKSIKLGVSVYDQMKPECLNSTTCNPGLELEIFSMVAKILNFEIEIKRATESSCGDPLKNGSWTGLLGMLQRGEIDMIGNLCRFNERRSNEHWLQGSWPVLQKRQHFLIKAPEAKYTFNVGGPFDRPTWLTFFYMIITFALIFICFYKLVDNNPCTTSVKKGIIGVCSIMCNMEMQMQRMKNRHVWLSFASSFGILCVIYSTFITAAILRPIAVHKPFKNNMDLVRALFEGRYKLLDFFPNPFILCYDTSTYNKFTNAIEKHGYHYYENASGANATFIVLNELLSNPNLVLVKSENQLRNYLNIFPNRSRLWLIKDELASEEWWGYYFRKNFSHRNLFDETLKTMDSSKENINGLYSPLSHFAVESESIRGQLPKKISVTLSMVNCMLVYYSGGMTLAIFVLLSEIFVKKLLANPKFSRSRLPLKV